MKKNIKLNGQNIKIDFEKIHISRDLDEQNRKENTNEYVINGKSYKVTSKSVRGRSGKFNVTNTFEGVNFPDNDKKIIEYIITKYGN